MGVTVIEADYRDLLHSPEFDIKCTTTNMIIKGDGKLVMGGGVAKLMLDEFPHVDRIFAEIIRRSGHRQMIQAIPDDTHGICFLVGFPTKLDYKDPSPLWLVERSMKQLVAFKAMVGARKVLLPAPGCGLGGLDWENEVKPAIEGIEGVNEDIHVCIKK